MGLSRLWVEATASAPTWTPDIHSLMCWMIDCPRPWQAVKTHISQAPERIAALVCPVPGCAGRSRHDQLLPGVQAGVLADIESEFAGMAALLAESDTQAVAREVAVRASKEQWIRLNADFDNFRKRTVRAADHEVVDAGQALAFLGFPAPTGTAWRTLDASVLGGMLALTH